MVAGLGTMMPALRRPMKAMKRPMPPATAAWSCGGWRREALADAAEGEQEEDDAGDEDGAEGGLPGHAHALDDGVGEVGVEAHAGREGERIVGERAHQDGAEGRAEAGRGGDGGEGHAGLREDGGVDEDDVGHRDEGGEAGEDLGAPGGLVLGEFEVGFCAFDKAWAGSHARRKALRGVGIGSGGNRIPEGGGLAASQRGGRTLMGEG